MPRSIAIDPGYDRVGIAIFEGQSLLHSECFTPPSKDFGERLLSIHEKLTEVISKFAPESLALETLFFSRNQKTAIKVAEARGVVLLIASAHRIPVYEYSPQAVKIAVTGYGASDKKAVTHMVDRLVPLSKKKRLDDEYDAIALGIAHSSQHLTIHNQPH